MSINKTTNINNLTLEQLTSICDSIRSDILDYVSENGGYLSDNLSIVEICVALNKVLNSNDKIIYTCKKIQYPQSIIDGEDICNIDNRYHDFSNALGYALTNTNNNIVVVMNNDDFNYGDNLEILNQFNHLNNKLIIIYNDNINNDKISIYNKLINNARNTNSYNNLKNIVKKNIKSIKNGEKIVDNIHRFKDSLKKNIVDEGIFENYNIDYIGPIDGHDINELLKAINLAIKKETPVVIHCLTIKGKGYKYALNNEQYDYISPFDIQSGKIYGQQDDNNLYCNNIISNTLLENNHDDLYILSNNIYQDGFSIFFSKIPEQSYFINVSNINKLKIASSISLDNKYPYITLNINDLNNQNFQDILNNLNKPLLITCNIDNKDNYAFISKLTNTNIYIAKDRDSLKTIVSSFYTSNKPTIILLSEKCMTITDEKLGNQHFLGNNDMNDILIISYGKDVDIINKLISENNLNYDIYDYCLINHCDDEFKKALKNYKHIYFYGEYFDYLKDNINATYLNKIGINKLFEYIEGDINA